MIAYVLNTITGQFPHRNHKVLTSRKYPIGLKHPIRFRVSDSEFVIRRKTLCL